MADYTEEQVAVLNAAREVRLEALSCFQCLHRAVERGEYDLVRTLLAYYIQQHED